MPETWSPKVNERIVLRYQASGPERYVKELSCRFLWADPEWVCVEEEVERPTWNKLKKLTLMEPGTRKRMVNRQYVVEITEP